MSAAGGAGGAWPEEETRRFFTSRSTAEEEDPTTGSLSELEQWRAKTVTGVSEVGESQTSAARLPIELLHSHSFSYFVSEEETKLKLLGRN